MSRRLLISRQNQLTLLTVVIASIGVLIGIGLGVLAGLNALYIAVFFVAFGGLFFFVRSFETAVLTLLVLRSALGTFEALQLPALFAIALNMLTIGYVIICWLQRDRIQTDRFWFFFAGWVAFQSIWVILPALGALPNPLVPFSFTTSLREWIRLFSTVLLYLLVMQLKGKVHPERVINVLFLGLIAPLFVGLLQLVVPGALPAVLAPLGLFGTDVLRLDGTMGHPNDFAVFLFLFMSFTLWKMRHAERIWPWVLLLVTLAFFLVNTQTMVVLGMTSVFVVVFSAYRASVVKVLLGLVLVAAVIGLYSSTGAGQERLASIAETPLLNPDMDISRSILLSWKVPNSFNWRLAQWTFLLNAWRESPWLGYGLHTSSFLSLFEKAAHSDYVRAMVEQGIVGFCAFITFWIVQASWLVQRLTRARAGSKQQSLCFALLAILMALMLGMLTENIWNQTIIFFYWWVLFVIVGWDWESPVSEPKTVEPVSVGPMTVGEMPHAGE
ncbi:MAG: O-antigen ligase family protein [Phormidesmis sp.]